MSELFPDTLKTYGEILFQRNFLLEQKKHPAISIYVEFQKALERINDNTATKNLTKLTDIKIAVVKTSEDTHVFAKLDSKEAHRVLKLYKISRYNNFKLENSELGNNINICSKEGLVIEY